ncbi:F-box/kelch-repeat protein [Prunus yedoensis var. nudiflora]|uniref:F-box/kelch-repeat protein n=1 Tax=Prunus yedoensis var. nudiflora TaxID=2094558 RepID=A0A314XMI0_PRUYE|nr:F-box/kelch-repeat protein [Prunus yedoensis var. nudiflora]
MSDVYSGSKKRTLSNILLLPEEIFDEILLRLPSKSVGRCSAVCKTWNSLVNTFVRNHTRYQSNSDHDAQLLFLQFHDSSSIINRSHYALHRDNSTCNVYTKLPNPFAACNKLPTCLRGAEKVEDLTLVGTCNGLICLVARDNEIHFAASIWNPCIRKLVALPKPGLAVYKDIDQVRYGFGYDSCTNDYKVLRCVNHKYIRQSTCQVEIWSLARGSWKSLSSAADHVILPTNSHPILPANFHPGQLFNRSGVVFVNGSLHWLQLARNWKVNKMDYLVASFDMASELFGEITVPEALRKKLHSEPRRREWFISRYRESIALVNICNDRERWFGCRVEIWVMAEYGVAASWANLCTMQLPDFWLMPLGFRKSGEVVLMRYINGDQSMLLDPESKQVSYFEIDGSNNRLKFMDYFVESLVLLDQPNAISY